MIHGDFMKSILFCSSLLLLAAISTAAVAATQQKITFNGGFAKVVARVPPHQYIVQMDGGLPDYVIKTDRVFFIGEKLLYVAKGAKHVPSDFEPAP